MLSPKQLTGSYVLRCFRHSPEVGAEFIYQEPMLVLKLFSSANTPGGGHLRNAQLLLWYEGAFSLNNGKHTLGAS